MPPASKPPTTSSTAATRTDSLGRPQAADDPEKNPRVVMGTGKATPDPKATSMGMAKPAPYKPNLGYEKWADHELQNRLANRKKLEYGGRGHRRRGQTDEDVIKQFWAESEDLYAQQAADDPEFSKKWEARAGMDHVRSGREKEKLAAYDRSRDGSPPEVASSSGGGGQGMIGEEEDSTIDSEDTIDDGGGMLAGDDTAPEIQPSMAATPVDGPQPKPPTGMQFPRTQSTGSAPPQTASTSQTAGSTSLPKPKMARNRKLQRLESKLGNLYK
jgi:hypothetical protein